MAIHPIEFRYGTPEMKKIWEEENKLQKMLDVESKLKLKLTTILQLYQNQLLKFVKMAPENMFISELHPMIL